MFFVPLKMDTLIKHTEKRIQIMIKTSSQDYKYDNSLKNYFLLNKKIKQTYNTRFVKQPIYNNF